MHQKRPFLTRKGDDGFSQGSSSARKGDRGFRQPAQLAYRVWLRRPLVKAGPGRASRRRTEQHQHTRPHWCGGRRRDLPRCRWAAAGPGRASRRRAERSSQRGRLAGGPPPTGTHSGRALRRPEHQRRNTPPRHNKTARLHRGRAVQSVSKAQRRITMMSGSPRPLSWRTLEIPSLEATSFAVPSMRGSS